MARKIKVTNEQVLKIIKKLWRESVTPPTIATVAARLGVSISVVYIRVLELRAAGMLHNDSLTPTDTHVLFKEDIEKGS